MILILSDKTDDTFLQGGRTHLFGLSFFAVNWETNFEVFQKKKKTSYFLRAFVFLRGAKKVVFGLEFGLVF